MTTSPSLLAPEVPADVAERRRFPRYRYSAPITVRPAHIDEHRGMSVEISECGASIVVGAPLNVGDTVQLEPIGGGAAHAVVRRCRGKLYGFEFLSLSAEQAAKIREICRMLPLYRSKTLDLWER
jgi:hypothetical protein